MLTDEIRAQMIQAMKAKDDRTKAILRVALGEVQTNEASSGEKLDDAGVQKILRKLVKSIEETLKVSAQDDRKAILEHELVVLGALLPQTLTKDQVVAALADALDEVRAAKSDGQATGVAMKHLKAAGAAVSGQDVAAAVREIRG